MTSAGRTSRPRDRAQQASAWRGSWLDPCSCRATSCDASEGSTPNVTVYLDYLTSRGPPRRLLASASRKAWRSARLRFGVRPLPPTLEELLSGMRAATPVALADRLATPGRGLVAHDRPAIAKALPRFFPVEAERAVARADRFAEAYVASLRDFVAQNPLDHGAQWACAMEAALRAVCVGQAHALFQGHRALSDPEYAVDLARLVVATGRFVLARLEDVQAVPNNHLAADWVGLLACAALVPEW